MILIIFYKYQYNTKNFPVANYFKLIFFEFGDGDGPNLCRVIKVDVSSTFIENIFRSGLTLVSSWDCFFTKIKRFVLFAATVSIIMLTVFSRLVNLCSIIFLGLHMVRIFMNDPALDLSSQPVIWFLQKWLNDQYYWILVW